MKNQLKAGVIISYLQVVLNIAIHLVYTPLMIKLLGKNEYGVYTLVASVVSYLSLFSLGFTGAYMRFHTQAEAKSVEDGYRVNGLFAVLFSIMSICALICGMILSFFPKEIFGSKLAPSELYTAKILMRILVVNIVLSFPASLFDSIIISREKFILQRGLMLLGTIVNPFMALPLLIMGYGSVALVIVTTTITVAKLLISIGYSFSVLKTRFLFRNLDFRMLKEVGMFSFFIFLNMIIDQINWNVDRLILGHTRGSSEIALYSVGAQINSLYITFSSTISNVFVPRVNRIALETDIVKRNREFSGLFIKVGRIQFAILSLICSGLVFFGEYFICNIYAGKDYQASFIVALFLIVPVTIPLIQNLGIEIQRAVNMHKFRSIAYLIMALINVGISIPLGIYYGAVGVAAGTTFGLTVSNGFIMNWYYHKKMGINIRDFWCNILKFSRGFIVPFGFGLIIHRFVRINSIMIFGVFVILYAIVYIVSIYMFSFNSSEKAYITNFVRRFKR